AVSTIIQPRAPSARASSFITGTSAIPRAGNARSSNSSYALNRIDATFAKLASAGRTALIPYVTVGDPSLATMPALLEAIAAAGADIIELGVPFSDPMADGPVIQRASERALAQH